MDILSRRSNDCPLSPLITSYASCTLEETQVVRLDSHLLECNQCSDLLMRVVDSGVAPEWLATVRKLKRATTVDTDHGVDRTNSSSTATEPVERVLPFSSEVKEDPEARYRLVRLHGEGGMGQVWEGWDSVLKRRIALKQLPAGPQHEKLIQRLVQEASSLARLSHPNIVSVFEIVALPQKPTIVMEFIDGPTLSRFRKDTVMGERDAAQILEKLASAVSHAHEQGVIHRDLKPGNVLLCWQGHGNGAKQDFSQAIPKLTDFGLARIVEEDCLTRTGDLLGTPAYMAPEQTFGQANLVGPGADIYGLGAILYELLVGTPPHVSHDPVATLISVREREPMAPRAIRAELSKDIETICLKCLRKQPKDRYARSADLQSDLRAFLDGRPIAARPLSPLVAAMRWSRRNKAIALAALTSLALFLTILVTSLWTASTERKLRLVADEAKRQAKFSQERIAAEASRANRALAVNQEHFDVALSQVTQLSLLLAAPKLYGLDARKEDYDRRIDEAIERIYATYLDALPPPEQWTLREAQAVCSFVEMKQILGKPQSYLPWQDRLETHVPRIERESSKVPALYDFLVRHNFCMYQHLASTGEFQLASEYGERAAKVRLSQLETCPDDVSKIREYSHILMTTGISYGKAGDQENAGRVVDKSLSLYRQILKRPDATTEDKANFLDKLMWHRRIYTDLGRTTEALEHVAEFQSLASEFDPSSEHYGRVQATISNFNSMPGLP